MKEKKIDVWEKDVLIKVSRETRRKLKLKAINTDRGLTVKELLKRYANEK